MSEILARACAYMVETKALDELEKAVEMDGFEAWLSAMESGRTNHDLRTEYHAKRELIQQIRNLAQAKVSNP